MLKGTQILTEHDALDYNNITQILSSFTEGMGYWEVILPSIWESKTFEDKIQGETLEQMWKFKDKGDRDVCLIPEATGIIQEMWNNHWSKNKPKPYRIFYVTKCFRYEKPQMGRLREFTQFGVEILGDNDPSYTKEARDLLFDLLTELDVTFVMNDNVKRGLGYYTENGFEAECPSLGAQKQVAGGGAYKEGVGFAIGIERLQLVLHGEASSVG